MEQIAGLFEDLALHPDIRLQHRFHVGDDLVHARLKSKKDREGEGTGESVGLLG